jgi:hypothetical protein
MLNERLTIQKGVFTCVGDVGRPFEENLVVREGVTRPDYLMRVVIPAERLDAAEAVNMNETVGSLSLV